MSLKNNVEEKYVGIKGWLRALIVYLRVIRPTGLLLAFGSFYAERSTLRQAVLGHSNQVLDDHEGAMAIYLAGQIGLVIYAFRTGDLLRRAAAGAVKSAKRFVIVDCLTDSLLLLFVSHLVNMSGATLPVGGKIVAYSLWGVILYSYLSLSKRVKATHLATRLPPNQVLGHSGPRTSPAYVSSSVASASPDVDPTTEARLSQLRQMYDQGLITEKDYYQKHGELFQETHKRNRVDEPNLKKSD